MSEALFTGVCTALVTPFINGSINYPMLQQLIQRQIHAGIEAIVIAGTTGESAALTDAEKITLFRNAKEYAGNQCLILAGTGSNSTEHAIVLSKAAEEMGVDGLLCVSPYYNKATPDGLYLHYRAIAESVRIPVVLYNVPSRTGMDISVSSCRQLAQIPNIVGIKEASSDITKTARILHECPEDFSVWNGNDSMTVPSISLGCKGVISVLSNLYPGKMQMMAKAALSGDYATAAVLQLEMMSMIDLLFAEVNPVPIKAAMKCIGFDCGSCRLPLSDASEKLKSKISDALRNE